MTTEPLVTLTLVAGETRMPLNPRTPAQADEFVDWLGQRKIHGDPGERISAKRPDGTTAGVIFIQHISSVTYTYHQ